MIAQYAMRLGLIVFLLSLPSPTRLFALSSGCGKPNRASGVSAMQSTDGRGRSRTYLLLAPATYNPNRSYSLIFVFHGAGGSASGSLALGLQNVPGAAESGIFVFPQGIPFENQGVGWDDTNKGYDMPFFDNMLREVEASYCIDSGEVFAAGFSWGGDFLTALSCNRGDTLRAIAINSSSDEFRDTSNYLTYEDLPCPSHRRPAIRFEHAVLADKAYPAPDFATTSKLYQYFNQCRASSTPISSSTHVMSCVSFHGCAEEFIECFFDPAIGHKLPPNWARDTWDFLLSFRKARPEH